MSKQKHNRRRNDDKAVKRPGFSILNIRNVLLAVGSSVLASGILVFCFDEPKEHKQDYSYILDDSEVRRELVSINEPEEMELNERETLDAKINLMNQYRIGLEDILIKRATKQSWIIPYDNPEDFSQSQEEVINNIDSLFRLAVGQKRLILEPK